MQCSTEGNSNRYVSHLQSSDRSNSTSTAVLIQYRPFPNRSIITLQTWQCNGIGSTKMRVTANYDARYSKLSVCCKYSIRFEFGIFSGILFGVYIWVKGSHQIKYKYY